MWEAVAIESSREDLLCCGKSVHAPGRWKLPAFAVNKEMPVRYL